MPPEVWHFYRGAPLELTIGKDRYVLGNDIDKAQVPQLVVPAGQWQMARSQGDFTPGGLHGGAWLRIRAFRNGAGRLYPLIFGPAVPAVMGRMGDGFD